MSEDALRQRRRNLNGTRLRSDRETAIIKLLIWQSCFEVGLRSSQRALARQLRVWPSYVCKVQKQSACGLEALASGQRVTLDDLAEARRFTAKLREAEPGILAPKPQSSVSNAPRVITTDEAIAETRREVAEWKLRNPPNSQWRTLTKCGDEPRGRRRVLFSVRVG